jgi:hypothetical protein
MHSRVRLILAASTASCCCGCVFRDVSAVPVLCADVGFVLTSAHKGALALYPAPQTTLRARWSGRSLLSDLGSMALDGACRTEGEDDCPGEGNRPQNDSAPVRDKLQMSACRAKGSVSYLPSGPLLAEVASLPNQCKVSTFEHQSAECESNLAEVNYNVRQC